MQARLCEPFCKPVSKFICTVQENSLLHAQRPAGHVGTPSFAPGRHGLQGPGGCGRSKRSTQTTTQRSYWRRQASWFEQHKNLGTTADMRLHRGASHVTSPHVLHSVSGCGCLASCAPTGREQRQKPCRHCAIGCEAPLATGCGGSPLPVPRLWCSRSLDLLDLTPQLPPPRPPPPALLASHPDSADTMLACMAENKATMAPAYL